MIENTFCILNGIGEKSEKRIWNEGVLTWKDFRDADDIGVFSNERKRLYDESLFLFSSELDCRNATFFNNTIKRREHWRLFETFKDHAVCLDIETNGLQPSNGGYVTVVGLFDGYDYRYLIRGENLTAENLNEEIARYKCLITFYGAAFDIPFLLQSFRGVPFNIPHFDLCFAAKRLGLQGGLKKLEWELGIERNESVQGFDGYDAVRLWELARQGSSEARDLLIAYNREDTVNLMTIAEILYKRLRQSTGIERYLHYGVH
jgi:uncharacterized protein YprB with RNaseH-like and TPR domain